MKSEWDQFVGVGDVWTRYWELGDASTSAVVLIHGLGASVETWEHNIEALAADHHVYAPDLVGFGYTDKPEGPYTADRFIGFVLDFMDVMGIDRAAILGHSMGGGIALRIAIDHPERVSHLIIADSAGLGRKVDFRLRLLALPVVGKLLLPSKREQVAKSLQTFFYDNDAVSDDFIDLNYRLISQPQGRRAYLSTVRHTSSLAGADPDVVHAILDRLDEIKAATLVLWGKQDPIVPPDQARTAYEGIPNADLYLFDKCGHIPMFERTKEFNDAVTSFLRAH